MLVYTAGFNGQCCLTDILCSDRVKNKKLFKMKMAEAEYYRYNKCLNVQYMLIKTLPIHRQWGAQAELSKE